MGWIYVYIFSIIYWGAGFKVMKFLSSSDVDKKMDREAKIYRWVIAIICYLVFLLALISVCITYVN